MAIEVKTEIFTEIEIHCIKLLLMFPENMKT